MTEPTSTDAATPDSTSDAAPQEAAPVEDAPIEAAPEQTPDFRADNGMAENAVAYPLPGEVNTTQLVAELTAAGATNVMIRMPDSFMDTGVLDSGDPIEVYVEGGTKKKIQDAVAAHVPDPTYGMTDEQKAQAEVLAKVQDTSVEVTTDDLRAALNALINPATADTGATA